MFIFLISVRCSSFQRTGNDIRASTNGAVFSFYVGLMGISFISLAGASEMLMFEMMLSCWVYVDYCTPNSKSISNFKMFLGYLIIFVTSYFGFTTAAMAFAAASQASSDSALALSSGRQVVAVVLSNALALTGGVYFIWTLHYESSAFGRNPIVNLRERSLANAKKVSSMVSVTASQMKLVMKAFLLSYRIAAQKAAINAYRSEEMSAFRDRLCSPSHLCAAFSQLTPQTVAAIETAAFESSCCKNLTRTLSDSMVYSR
jgi:hypothetical protein